MTNATRQAPWPRGLAGRYTPAVQGRILPPAHNCTRTSQIHGHRAHALALSLQYSRADRTCTLPPRERAAARGRDGHNYTGTCSHVNREETRTPLSLSHTHRPHSLARQDSPLAGDGPSARRARRRRRPFLSLPRRALSTSPSRQNRQQPSSTQKGGSAVRPQLAAAGCACGVASAVAFGAEAFFCDAANFCAAITAIMPVLTLR